MDLNSDVFVECIEAVLKAGERGEVGGLDVSGVRAGTVALDETEVSELEAAAIAAAIEHIPPKGQQTIRYYGLYSNKSRGIAKPNATIVPSPPENIAEETPPRQIHLIPAPLKTPSHAKSAAKKNLGTAGRNGMLRNAEKC